MSLKERYLKELSRLQEKGLLREDLFFEGKDFVSNDYFWLRRSEDYLKAIRTPLKAGSGGSRYLGGYTPELQVCEQELAQFYGCTRAFLFPSGYMANIAILSALTGPRDIIFYDEEIHASLKDGIRLSLAQGYSFTHLNLTSLEEKVKRWQKQQGQIFVVSESVFSMHGDILPIKEWLAFCEKYGLYLILDEAHAAGILGSGGKGLGYNEKSPHLLCRMVGLGKAFALQGGVALFHEESYALYFAQKARPLIYSTAMNPALCNMITLAHRYFRLNQASLKQELDLVITQYIELAREHGFTANQGHPIQVIASSPSKTVYLAQKLREAGIACKAILPPTVKPGRERIRLVLKRCHSFDDLQLLFQTIKNYA
ncbi:MAG: aminotransferase class I/II-fold pyridoxal phosphate-dependent enzyme [Leptospiraceae bacterium]|nr:aminotransferase class I/II-fold pyridoxal phosphate-dependent enzyme [Leptospiraceae bacterium]MDW8305487.1 aminotransferase class I/II-fold pyridoxal phosphate-dependent enzyme [Leptospiraceae bacterium]